MLITHEADYGGEYHVRVKLTETDIEGIATTLRADTQSVDGRLVAQFLRRAVIEALAPTSPQPPAAFR